MPLVLREITDTEQPPISGGLRLTEVPYEPEQPWHQKYMNVVPPEYMGEPSGAASLLREDVEEFPVVEDRYSGLIKDGIQRGVQKIREVEPIKTKPVEKPSELGTELREQAEDLPDMEGAETLGIVGALPALAVAPFTWVASKIAKYSQYLPERGIGEDAVDLEDVLAGKYQPDPRSLDERAKKGKEIEEAVLSIPSMFIRDEGEMKVLRAASKPFEWLDNVLEKAVSPLPEDLREPVKDFFEILVIVKGPRVAKSTIGKIKNSTPYRMANIKERGLAVQDLAETLKKNPEISEAELVRGSDSYFKESLGKRKVKPGLKLREVKPKEKPSAEKPQEIKTDLSKISIDKLKVLRKRYKEEGMLEDAKEVEKAIDKLREQKQAPPTKPAEVVPLKRKRTEPKMPWYEEKLPHPKQDQIDWLKRQTAEARNTDNKAQVEYLENLRSDVEANRRWLSEGFDKEKGKLKLLEAKPAEVAPEVEGVKEPWDGKERREFFGIRDKVDRGLMTKEDARAGKKPKVEISESRLTANAADLAADYKAKGVERQVTYSQFVKDRALKPEMDAKDFYAIYDSVTPKLLSEPKPTPKAKQPTERPVVEPEGVKKEEFQVIPSQTVGMPGDKFEGFITDKEIPVPEGAKPPKKPIRREDVLIPLLKDLKVSVYEGRVKGKTRAGFYIPKKEAVRIKKKSDLEVTAHEIAHLIDDRVFGGFRGRKGKRPWLKGEGSKIYAKELKDLSYDKKKVYEGYAEFVRHWMTNPDVVAVKAPKFTQWWENFVETSEYGKTLKTAQEGMRSWFAQDKLSRARSKVGIQRNLNESVDNIWDRMRQSVIDDLHGVLRPELDLTGKRYPMKQGAYETARLSKAAYSIVDGAIRFGAPKLQKDGSFKFEGKSLKKILKQVDNIEDWASYAIGRSARELSAQGRENLFTKGEIEAMTALETPEYKRVFDEWLEWNNAVVDFAQELGFINPLERANWKRTQYLPFYRIGQKQPAKRIKGIEGNSKATYILTGGTGNLNNVVHNMVQNARHLIVEAIKNDARLKIVDTMLGAEARGGGRYIVKIPKDTKSISVEKEQIRKEFYKALGLDPKWVDQGMLPFDPSEPAGRTMIDLIDQFETGFSNNPDFMKFWLHGQSPAGDNIVAVRRKGKTEYYEVFDPLLYRGIAALNTKPKGAIRRFFNTGRRIGQGTVTLTLDFMTANIWRDTWHGWVLSDHGFKPIASSLKGMASRIKQDQNYKDFIANGAGMSSYLVDPVAFEKRIKGFYKKKGIDYKTVINTPGKMLYALETMADAFEMATRLGEFSNAVKKGEHPRHAAYLAREISTDFAMKGDSEAVGAAYDSILFLKAAVNGMDRVYRGLAKDRNRGKTWLKTGLIAGFSTMLYLMNRGRPEYDDLEDFDQDGHWHVFIDREEKEPVHLRFPKLWEIGAMASVAERSMEYYLDSIEKKYPGRGKEYAKRIGNIILDQFKFDYIPYLIEPPYEVFVVGKERFTGRPIETEAMKGREPFARYSSYTSRALVKLAEQTKDLPKELQLSPAKVEALITGYLNTFGYYGLFIADAIGDDQKPSKKASEWPVLRRFYRQEPGRTKYNKEFWEYYKDATQLHNTVRFMADQNRPEITEDLLQKDAEHYYDVVMETYKMLQDLRSEMELIYMDPKMDKKRKRKEIDNIKTEMNKIMKETVLEIKE